MTKEQLMKLSKSALLAKYNEVCPFTWTKVHPSKWRKEELATEIEYHMTTGNKTS